MVLGYEGLLEDHLSLRIASKYKVATARGGAIHQPLRLGSGNLANILLVICYLSDYCQQSDNVGHFTFARYF